MLENKTCDVAPLVATVRLLDDEQFDTKHPEAYTYETIGGNHSRIALTQLLKEKKELALDPKFFNRRVSVYTRLSDEQAQHLAHRHNRATEFTSKMNTQDKVLHTRIKLHVYIHVYTLYCLVSYTRKRLFSGLGSSLSITTIYIMYCQHSAIRDRAQ